MPSLIIQTPQLAAAAADGKIGSRGRSALLKTFYPPQMLVDLL